MIKAFVVICACMGAYFVLPKFFHGLENTAVFGISWSAIIAFLVFCVAINFKSE